ncbi:uncharacterized protein LOC132734365 [Ruditapes philippinarum]|uniref:uncharacterized protein LOC132734365 n=1 Tax=Ruditapes philippinarum TaxID=129788 RepID=UPI00295BA12F|nr:uncharacterized protein LOC132734365 [Ruditapes philippinarum]
MDATYGNVASTERLKEQFYSASKWEGESIVDYSLRLEYLLVDSQITLDRKTRDDMLRNRLWSGLRNQDLKNATRYKFEAELDYTRFRRELRLVEEEMKLAQQGVKSSGISSRDKYSTSSFPSNSSDRSKEQDVRQCSTSVESKILQELQDVTAQLKTLNSRVTRIERDLDDVKKNRYRSDGNRWRGRGTDIRSQETEPQPPSSSNSATPSKTDKPLNQQAPPPKGHHYKRCFTTPESVPSPWDEVFSSIPDNTAVQVKVFTTRPMYIQPFQVFTVPGIVRGSHFIRQGVTEDDENLHSFNVCPRLVEVDPSRSFSVLVRICNMSVGTVRIMPKSSICLLQDVNVVRSVDPLEATSSNIGAKDMSLEDLGVDLSKSS